MRAGEVALDVVDAAPMPPDVQIVAVFDNLAVTQRQLNAGIASLIGALDDESILDMQSVDGELDDALVEAVNDLHARGAGPSRRRHARPGQRDGPLGAAVLAGARPAARGGPARRRRRTRGPAHRPRRGVLRGSPSPPFPSRTSSGSPPTPAAASSASTSRPTLGDTLAGIGRELGMQYLVTFLHRRRRGSAGAAGGHSARGRPQRPRGALRPRATSYDLRTQAH